MKQLKWFEIENTGFTNGTNWYGLDTRFETFEKAKEGYEFALWDDKSVKWRIVEVTFTRYFEDESNIAQVTKSIRQERYLYL